MPGRDAGAHDRDDRQPHRARCSPPARATPTARRSTTSPTPARASSPGLSVTLRHRARPLPRPRRAGGVGDRARAGAAVAVRRPRRAGDLRRPGDRRPALVLGDVLRARAAQRRAPAGAARARALPAVPGGGDGRGGGRRRRARVPRLERRRWSSHGESAPLWPSWRRVS